jgi:hypothetical protein
MFDPVAVWRVTPMMDQHKTTLESKGSLFLLASPAPADASLRMKTRADVEFV